MTLAPAVPGAVGEFSWPLPFAPASASAARTHVAEVLHAFDIDTDRVDDARLVVSELMGNAVRHGSPRRDGHVLLTVAVDAESVSIGVADGDGHSIPSVVKTPPMSLCGRGLRIVHTVSQDWGVRTAAEGKTVFAVVTTRA